jgi:hypothetical protein
MHIIFVSVATPGKSSKQVTLEKSSLHSIISQLPLGVHIIGDVAYIVSDQILWYHSQDQADSILAMGFITIS